MVVKNFKKDRLQNMEHFQFTSHVVALCEAAGIEKMKTLLKTLKDALAEEDKALNIPRKREGTADLEELDRKRNSAYRALQLLVEMNAHADDEATKKAARQMSNVLSRYPKLTLANYNKETGMIKNLVSDLQDAKLTEVVTLLAAAPAVTRLSKANEAFEKRYLDALKSVIPTGTYDIKALRAATDKALSAIALRMEALNDLEPETLKLPELIVQYNALVDIQHATLSHRAGTSKVAHDKRTAAYNVLLKYGFPALETALNLEIGSLSFTGKTEGTGDKRHYELAIEGETNVDGSPKTIWVGINKDTTLFKVERKPTSKSKQADKPSISFGKKK